MADTIQSQHGSYTAHQRNDETVRETEARALLSCASRLEAARQPESTMDDYIDSIKHNQQLWTIFQVCLCEPENPIPSDLKYLLLNLSRYVDKVSFRALSDYNPNLLNSLININRNIAAGLSVKPKTEGTGPGDAKSGNAPTSAPPSSMIVTTA